MLCYAAGATGLKGRPAPKWSRQDADVSPMDTDPVQPDESMELPDEPELRAIYMERWSAIRTHHATGRKVQDRYNYRYVQLENFTRIMST